MALQILPDIRSDRSAADDATLEALADDRRRIAVDCLPAPGEPVALADLARDVAVRESDDSFDEISDERLASVERTLYHVHLPKLDDADLVAFDANARTVERAPAAADRPIDL